MEKQVEDVIWVAEEPWLECSQKIKGCFKNSELVQVQEWSWEGLKEKIWLGSSPEWGNLSEHLKN